MDLSPSVSLLLCPSPRLQCTHAMVASAPRHRSQGALHTAQHSRAQHTHSAQSSERASSSSAVCVLVSCSLVRLLCDLFAAASRALIAESAAAAAASASAGSD